MEIGGVDWALNSWIGSTETESIRVIGAGFIFLYFHYFYCDFPYEFSWKYLQFEKIWNYPWLDSPGPFISWKVNITKLNWESELYQSLVLDIRPDNSMNALVPWRLPQSVWPETINNVKNFRAGSEKSKLVWISFPFVLAEKHLTSRCLSEVVRDCLERECGIKCLVNRCLPSPGRTEKTNRNIWFTFGISETI